MGAWQLLIGQPLDEVLTASIRLALPFMQSGVASGFSANKILGLLTDAGLGVNRQLGLKVIKSLTTPFGAPTITKSSPTGEYPNPGLFRVAPYPTSRNYTYVYEIVGVNPISGQTEVQHISVVSDTLLTHDDAAGMAEDYIDTGQSGNGLEDLETTLIAVKLSPTFNL